MYNGHKRVHAIKFQAVSAPNGLRVHLSGSFEGKKHDSTMLYDSGLLSQLGQYSFSRNGNILCIYGDPAYPVKPQLLGPFGNLHLTADQKAWNKSTNSVLVSVEWIFGDFKNYFKFLDFKKNLKMQLSAVGKSFIVCTILQNARSYGSVTSRSFEIDPPVLNRYFV